MSNNFFIFKDIKKTGIKCEKVNAINIDELNNEIVLLLDDNKSNILTLHYHEETKETMKKDYEDFINYIEPL